MIELIKDDGQGFSPPCISQLMGPNLISYHAERNLPHPITAFNTSWWKLQAQFFIIMDLLEGYVVGSSNERNKAVMEAVESLYFKTAIFTDVLENIIPAALLSDQKSRFLLPKTVRRELMMPANKLKHEANDITLCGARWGPINVTGYMIFHMRERSKIANPLFHENRDAYSFNVEIRRLLVNIYRFASAVGEKVAVLGSGTGTYSGSLDENVSLLMRVNNLPRHCWWDEAKLMPTFEFDGEKLKLDIKGGQAIAIDRSQAEFTALGTMDGYTQHIGFRGRAD